MRSVVAQKTDSGKHPPIQYCLSSAPPTRGRGNAPAACEALCSHAFATSVARLLGLVLSHSKLYLSVGEATPPLAMTLMQCAPRRSSSRAARRTWAGRCGKAREGCKNMCGKLRGTRGKERRTRLCKEPARDLWGVYRKVGPQVGVQVMQEETV